jgi:hypothetical protein
MLKNYYDEYYREGYRIHLHSLVYIKGNLERIIQYWKVILVFSKSPDFNILYGALKTFNTQVQSSSFAVI